MRSPTQFSGRILQVLESFDYGDAVSNQARRLDAMLRGLGFSCAIYSKWHHEKVADLRSDLEEAKPTDEDIVVLHFSGRSEHALPFVQQLRCTKVCVYHNITPDRFFLPGTPIHEHCMKGRRQLPDVVRGFHRFWGDSAYNLQELQELGANPSKCAVVPIIVGQAGPQPERAMDPEPGAWMFLGRIAANKGQINLVRLFASLRKEEPSLAQRLYLVGAFERAEPYHRQLVAEVHRLGLGEQVVITGKVADADIEGYFARAAIYVSMSEHEGFGVPLIEAARHGVPVVALRNTAVGETMGPLAPLGESADEMKMLVKRLLSEPDLLRETLEEQQRNALRFTPDAVETRLAVALEELIPGPNHFATVSVVICTYNRRDFLERCLDYLQYQANPNFEVVVVNGPSTDDTEAILDRYNGRIKVARTPERNLSKSRNLGIELAGGDLIAFIDDDALPFDDWGDTLLAEFNRRPLTVAGLGGPVYYAGSLEFQAQDSGVNRFAEAREQIDFFDPEMKDWRRYPTGTNACFRADVLREVNGFDEQFDYYLDESELCFRLQERGHLVGYCADLYVRHEFAQSHNRGGKHNYNWFTICKNTAYFVAAYSGLKGKELADYLDRRMADERIPPLAKARDIGEISEAAYQKHVDAIQSGVRQGLADARGFPRTRALQPALEGFRAFQAAADQPPRGRDLVRRHVCFLTKEFPPFSPGGGIGTLFYHLASELLLMGHFVSVVIPGGDESTYRRGRFTVRYTGRRSLCSDAGGAAAFTSNLNWSLSALHALAALHQERPVDVVESALWDSEGLALSLLPREARPALVVRLVTPFPVSARLNGWTVSARESAFLSAAERALLDGADAIVPISDSIAVTIEEEYGISRGAAWSRSDPGIAYWPAFDVRFGYSELKEINGRPLTVPDGSRIVLFVGRLESRKGIDLLLEAANSFLRRDPAVHLVVAGRDVEGWIPRAKGIVARELADRIHFLGEVDDATREKLLNAAYCVVFPSRYESFGLVPLEAFVHGVPVIASNAGAIPEVVRHEECGLLFSPTSKGALALCVERLLADPQLRARLAGGTRERIRHFSSRNSALRAVSLYARIAPSDGAHPASEQGRQPAAREIQAYYDTQFKRSEQSGSIYEPMTPLLKAAHYRRMALLDALPVGSLEGKTVVDFGTGSWGFACVYPRLHACKLAIGMDISAEAVRLSKAVSAKGSYAYGDRCKYYVSDGTTIPLADASVDLFFTGECIEHVENTDAFLDEIYRVLVPNGVLVLTTPNSSAIGYRDNGDRNAVGPEHIALMDYQELLSYLMPRFTIETSKGYNTSVHTSLDDGVRDEEIAQRHATAHEDQPEDASGVIIMARKKAGWLPRKRTCVTYLAGSPELARRGAWTDMDLHQSLRGLMGKPGSELSLTFSGNTLIVLLWSHPWSGIAELTLDGQSTQVDLFEHVGGFRRIVFNDLDADREHSLVFRPAGAKNVRSQDDQVIFYSASAYATD